MSTIVVNCNFGIIHIKLEVNPLGQMRREFAILKHITCKVQLLLIAIMNAHIQL